MHEYRKSTLKKKDEAHVGGYWSGLSVWGAGKGVLFQMHALHIEGAGCAETDNRECAEGARSATLVPECVVNVNGHCTHNITQKWQGGPF